MLSWRKLIKKGAKAKSDEIIEAIKGYNIETDQAKKLELARAHLEYLNDMITQTEVELYVRIKPYYKFVEYVSTLPGMTELSSTIVLAETGVDMNIFDDAKHLCSWCSLAPACNESANKKKSSRIAKAGTYLKPMMVQCALTAIKSNKESYFAIKYRRLKKRRGHKKAIIAIARMMIVSIYHIVSDKKPFTPSDYEELINPQNQEKRVVLNDFIEFLKILDKKYPSQDKIQIILDNHSAHTSKETKNFLSTMPKGRFEFVFTPKHGSWLNMIESFFSKMTKQMLRGIRVKSKQELIDRIYLYFDEINKEPVVYHWKYKMDEICEQEANNNLRECNLNCVNSFNLQPKFYQMSE